MENLIKEFNAVNILKESRYFSSEEIKMVESLESSLVAALRAKLEELAKGKRTYTVDLWHYLHKNPRLIQAMPEAALDALTSPSADSFDVQQILETREMKDYLLEKSEEKTERLRKIMVEMVASFDNSIIETKSVLEFSEKCFAGLKELYPEVAEAIRKELLKKGYKAGLSRQMSEIDDLCRFYGAV